MFRRCILSSRSKSLHAQTYRGQASGHSKRFASKVPNALMVQSPQSVEETSRVHESAEKERQDQEKGAIEDIPNTFTRKTTCAHLFAEG